MVEGRRRRAWAEVDLDAIGHNVRVLRRLAGSSLLCVVVKADAYGHGAVPVAHAALAAGATWLAVALVDEGIELRDAGIHAPILVLAEPTPECFEEALRRHLTLTLYSPRGVRAAEEAAAGLNRRIAVHLKVDTGMRRVGADPDATAALARSIATNRLLSLEGLWTHLAVADDPAFDHETARQVARFEEVRDMLAAAGIVPDLLHVANSAGIIAHPPSHYDMVRCGIVTYGYAPSASLAGRADLRPAMSLKAEVSFVKEVAAGDRLSYGHTYEAQQRTVVATVPLGYADGVRRQLSRTGAQVLVGGRRYPIAGTITMDQLLVDCGPESGVRVGDEVVLLGRQGGAEITADDWAMRLETIPYEILCSIGPRVPRVYSGVEGVQEMLAL